MGNKEIYEEKYSKVRKKNLRHWEKLALTLIRKNCGKVLDVGCGTGKLIKRLKSKNYEVFGIDISENALGLCREKGLKKLFQIDIESSSLPFEDKFFDYVTCLEVLEHLNDQQNILSEIKRVLKDDGQAIISIPNSNFFMDQIPRFFGKPWKEIQNPRHVSYFNLSTFKELVSKYFRIRELRGYFSIPILVRYTDFFQLSIPMSKIWNFIPRGLIVSLEKYEGK